VLLRCCVAAGKVREVTTIYEVVEDKDGAVYALPDYQFTYGNTSAYKGPKSASCVPKSGSIPDSNVKVPWAQTYNYAPGEANRCSTQVSFMCDPCWHCGGCTQVSVPYAVCCVAQ
jgi:hypothetical protein